jgi:hypothetical protein
MVKPEVTQAPDTGIFHQEKEISLDDNDDDFLPETETPVTATLAPSQPVIFHEGRIFERFLYKVVRNLLAFIWVVFQYLGTYIFFMPFFQKKKFHWMMMTMNRNMKKKNFR